MRYILLFLCCLALFSLAWAGELAASYAPLAAQPELEAALLRLTNEARTAEGLNALSQDDALALAARHHAAEMATMNYLSHTSPTPQNATLDKRLARAGSPAVTAGENIAQLPGGDNLAERTIDGWMNSPNHRENMLREDYTHVGFGAATDSLGNRYLVQVLAYQPLTLSDSSIESNTRKVATATVTVELAEAGEVLLSQGTQSAQPQTLEAGRHDLILEVPASESVHLRAGVRAAEGDGFILQDSGWLDAAENTWQADPHTPKEKLTIQNAQAQTRAQRHYTITLTFDRAPEEPLAVFLNDEYQRTARVSGKTLTFELPGDVDNPVFDIGFSEESGRVQVILSLSVDWTHGAPRLVAS